MRVGWIGLGQMGAPMARRVLAAGHSVAAYVRSPAGVPEVAGVTLVPSAAAAAQGAEVLCVCLFDDSQTRDALLAQGALAALKPGAVATLHTTGDAGLMRELAARAPEGVAIIDAPFSGTAVVAAEGRLTLLVGGDAAALERARPVLSAFGDAIVHVGPMGAGRSLKLINNLLFAAQMSLADEALAAAAALGLEPRAAARAMGLCSAASYALAKFDHADAAGMLRAITPYLDKDADLARQALLDAGAEIPLLDAAARWGSSADN